MNAIHTKPSDESHRIKVDSAILSAHWLCDRAWAGAEAPFEVSTAFAGEGAEVKVRLVNGSGRVLEKKDDVVYANRLRGAIAVPSNKVKPGDMLHLEVELPKQGLDIESEEVPAGPAIQARKLEWDRKEAKRGDTVVMKAEFIDLPDKTRAEVKVYEYGEDGLHDPVAAIPVIIRNDRLELKWAFKPRDPGTIPTQAELKPYDKNYCAPEYFFTVTVDGTEIGLKQESGLLKFADRISIRLNGADGKPLPNEKYTIILPDGSTRKGSLDADGAVKEEDIPPGNCYIFFPDRQ